MSRPILNSNITKSLDKCKSQSSIVWHRLFTLNVNSVLFQSSLTLNRNWIVLNIIETRKKCFSWIFTFVGGIWVGRRRRHRSDFRSNSTEICLNWNLFKLKFVQTEICLKWNLLKVLSLASRLQVILVGFSFGSFSFKLPSLFSCIVKK